MTRPNNVNPTKVTVRNAAYRSPASVTFSADRFPFLPVDRFPFLVVDRLVAEERPPPERLLLDGELRFAGARLAFVDFDRDDFLFVDFVFVFVDLFVRRFVRSPGAARCEATSPHFLVSAVMTP